MKTVEQCEKQALVSRDIPTMNPNVSVPYKGYHFQEEDLKEYKVAIWTNALSFLEEQPECTRGTLKKFKQQIENFKEKHDL